MTYFLAGLITRLRLYREDDIDQVLAGINNPEIQKHVMLLGPLSREQQTQWLESVMQPTPTNKVFAVETLSGELVGSMSLHGIDLVNGIAGTGALLFNEALLGKGYGTDAKFALLNWAFKTLPLRKIVSKVKASNPRSQAYLHKTGYEVVGTFRKHLLVDGEYVDVHAVELWREAFFESYRAYTASSDP